MSQFFQNGKLITSVLVLSLFISVHSWAISKPSCPNTDYSSCLGAVRNQAGTAWCAAFTAADLLSCHEKLESGNQISAVDVAVQGLDQIENHIEANSEDTETNMLKSIVAKSLSEKRYNANLANKGNFTYLNLLSYGTKYRHCTEKEIPSQSARAFKTYSSDSYSFIEEKLISLGQARKTDLNNNLLVDAEANCNRPFKPNSLSLLPVDQMNLEAMQKIKSNLSLLCKNDSRLSSTIPESHYFNREEKGDQSASSVTAKWLHGGPVSILYPGDFLTDTWNTKTRSSSPTHDSVISGMRWNHSKCEFHLRNSWGQDCHLYRANLAKRCENGSIWISEKELNEIVWAATRIK